MMEKAKILLIDDEKAICDTFKEILEFENYFVDCAQDGKTGIDMALTNQYSLIYTDVKMPPPDGMKLLQTLINDPNFNHCPIVMISGHGNIEIAVEALKKGAWDFIEKPIDLNRLLVTTKNAIEKNTLTDELIVKNKEIKKLQDSVSSRYQMIGESEAIDAIRKLISKVAPTDARVLITGENGTGKEIIAHLIHRESRRANLPMVEVNCAAIPSELIESELFGHVKGSFTGAVKDRAGKFEQAHNSTLFLDEIGDMSLSTQAKVLRALQENRITRVGSDKVIDVNVRVIAATNKNLALEIKNGTFREDLFHRLNVIPIHLPPLRERQDDIPLLIDFFVQQICNEQHCKTKIFSKEAVATLQKRPWTGNVRELRNVVERLIILANSTITPDDVNQYCHP